MSIISNETLNLSKVLKEAMTIDEGGSLITISEDSINNALKENGLDIETVDKVNTATKKILNATLHAAGELLDEKVFRDENTPQIHTAVFHMNQFKDEAFTHTYNRLENNDIEIHTVYDRELQGTDYVAVSDYLKEKFKVEL